MTSESLATGVQFTRQQGQQGWVQSAGGDRVQVDYIVGREGYREAVLLQGGVYPIQYVDLSAPPDVIGVWSNTQTAIQVSGRPPVPVPGGEWSTTIRIRVTGDDFSGRLIDDRYRLEGVYRFLAEEVVTLSGCQYRMIPVELTMRNENGAAMERSVYFPDLGFAIRTQRTNLGNGSVTTNGLTAMRPAG